MNLTFIFTAFLACFLALRSCSQKDSDCEDGVFLEKDGIVVFEAENIALSDGWELEKEVEGFSGKGYITWKDSTVIEADNQGLLAYDFVITKPGTYTVKIRNYHSCDDFTECNDVFLKMNDSDWRKNFNHTVSEWDWNSQQDIAHVFSDASYLLEKGQHTLYLCGRSKDFSLDKIALYHSETTKNEFKTTTTSICMPKQDIKGN